MQFAFDRSVIQIVAVAVILNISCSQQIQQFSIESSLVLNEHTSSRAASELLFFFSFHHNDSVDIMSIVEFNSDILFMD